MSHEPSALLPVAPYPSEIASVIEIVWPAAGENCSTSEPSRNRPDPADDPAVAPAAPRPPETLPPLTENAPETIRRPPLCTNTPPPNPPPPPPPSAPAVPPPNPGVFAPAVDPPAPPPNPPSPPTPPPPPPP